MNISFNKIKTSQNMVMTKKLKCVKIYKNEYKKF